MKNNSAFRISICIALLCLGYDAKSQLAVTEGAAMGMTPQELVEGWLVGQGVFVSNCTYNGSTAMITSNGVGTFTASGDAALELGLPAGVLITSGQASLAIGPNSSGYAGAGSGTGGDPDLSIIANNITYDKAVIEFDFVPQSDTLKFRYVFGSEEFYEYCNQYNDAFGFFLSGPGISGTFSNSSVNIALMPGAPLPVTINNLCEDLASNWTNPPGGINFQYDGMSYVFTAWHIVTPCSTYHIKLAVADALDAGLDSGVFLEKNSFNATGLLVNNSFMVPKLGTKAVEGCNEVTVSFILSHPMAIPYTVHYTVGGTAIRGVDYIDIPDSLVIAPGLDSVAIVIDPILDGITEGIETCVLFIEQPSCTGTTIYHDSIFLHDPKVLALVPENDTTICEGDSARLYALPIGGELPLQYLWNIAFGTDTAITVSPPVGVNLYHVVVEDMCGTQAFDTALVTVQPLPHFTNTDLRDTLCPGGTTNFVFQVNTPSTFTWTAVNPGGNITGYSPGSGPAIIQTLQNNTTSRDSVIYTVIPQSSLCQGSDTTFVAVVQPMPDVIVNNTTPIVCDNQIINIGLSSTLAGASFSWTATCASPFVSGYANGTGNVISDKLYNSGTTIDTVKYFITASANGCSGIVVQTNVIVNPIPVITNVIVNKTICSATSTNIPLTSNVTGATFSWIAGVLSGSVTGYSNGTGSLIDQVLTNTGFIPAVVRYRVTPSANGCNGATVDFEVTVNPQPDVSNTASSYPVCSGNAANIALTSNVPGVTFTWTAVPSAPTLSGYTNGSGPVIADVLVNSATQTDSVAYTIVPDAGGCPGTPKTIHAVVYPIPNAYSTPASATLCSGDGTNFLLTSDVTGAIFSWTAVPSSGNVTGFSPGTGNAILQTLSNSGNTIETVTYTITPVVTGCPAGPSITATATVNPVPQLTNMPLSKEICNNTFTNITLTSNVAGTLFTWTCTPSSGNITGWANNAVPSNTLDQLLVNTGFNSEVVTYAITPAGNGCYGPPANYVVTVKPTPDLSNTPLSKTQCNNTNTNLTLTSNVAGTLFTWTCTQTSGQLTGWSPNPGPPSANISQILSLSGSVKDSVIYHLTPIANGCSGPVTDFKVIANPVPSLITNPMHDTVCSGDITGIVLLSTCPGTTFTWTASLSSGNITGFSNGSGSLIQQTLVNQLPTYGFVTYTILPSTLTCTGSDTTFEQYVRPEPHLTNSPADTAICNNAILNILLTSDVPGTLFTWTCTPSSANITGWSDNGIPTNSINHQLINSSTTIETVTYHIIPTANSCPGTSTDYVVTVYPTPDLSNTPASQGQCNNQNTNLLLTSNVAGTLFTWTCTPSSANITGWSNNAIPSGSINHLLVSTSVVPETVTYHLTPSTNGCAGNATPFVVTVNPTPDLSNDTLTKVQCDNQNTNILLTSNVAGALFTWTCTPSSGNITGWSNNAIPSNSINQQLINSSNIPETVTYHITPTMPGCNGPLTDFTVTVYPAPDLSNTPLSMQICNNTATNLTLTSNVAGTQFTWTCTPSSANVTGWSNNAIPTTLLNQTLTNLGLNPEFVTYAVTPSANGCYGSVFFYTVNVVSSPDVIFSPGAQTICSQQTSNIQISSSVPGATFTWTATPTGPSITGHSAGSGNLIAQTITNAGTTIGGVTYQVIPSAFGCPPGVQQNVVLTVNPTPLITNGQTAFQICSGTPTNIVPVSNVAGSTYSWTATGSSGNVSGFSGGSGLTIAQTLLNTGFNNETVTYQVIPSANGCPGPAMAFTVTVFPVADVIFNPNGQSLCSGATTSINIFSSAAGVSFTWIAAGSGPSVSGYSPGSGNLIQQTLFNSGPYPETATYIVSPSANGCPGTNGSVAVTVNPLPAVTFTPCFDPAVSVNASPITLRGGVPVGGFFSGPGVSGSIFDPAMAGIGVHSIIYAYTNMWGCSDNASATINVVNVTPFACGGVLTDPRDNQSYPTVQIGSQCWMASNLNYGNTVASGQMQRDNCIPEKYCYGDNPGNCASIGGMYQWDELMGFSNTSGAQGMCPPEWHLPSEAEWNTLFNVYVSSGFAGSPLKNTGYSGFNAFLSGTRFNNTQWDFSNFAVMYWSSTSQGQRKAWAHGMNSFDPSVSYYPSHRNNAFFVRCIKD